MTYPGTTDQPVLRTVQAQYPAGGRGRLLHLERQEAFVPGQVIGLAMAANDQPRWYSIASSPGSAQEGTAGQADYQVLYTPTDGGRLTPELTRLQAGDRLWLWLPRGSFQDPALASQDAGGPARPPVVWWIANGTGVAPFASFFRAGIRQDRCLVHGCLSPAEAWFSPEFLQASAGQPPCPGGFSYLPCLSRETEPALPGAFAGRLSAWLRQSGAAAFGPADHFMLCGSPGMVVEVREFLISLGVPHERIASETYF